MMRRLYAGLLGLVLLAVPALAQDASSSTDQLHDELRALAVTMETALNGGDVDALLAHVHPEVVFTTMNGDVVRGPEAIRLYFEKMMTGPDRVVESVSVDFEPDDLSVLHGDDMAIAFGTSADHYELTAGTTFDVSPRWSGTMVRQDGRWLIASFHYSTNMFDNPVLDAQRTLLSLVLGGGGLLLAILAFFIGKRIGSKRAG